MSKFHRLYTGEGGIDFIGRTRLWYWITAVLLVVSIGAIGVRGFDLGIDFEGGTKLNIPAAELSTEAVGETFTEATGVTPELVQIVGAGDTRTLEIKSQRLSDEQIAEARRSIFEEFHPEDAHGNPSPDAIGDSTVSESWGDTITHRMVIAMIAFLALAFVYIALRLQREMAVAAMLALLVDAVVIAGIYALFGFEVTPATVIGLLTVLAFSIYDTVIVFDKVRENTEGLKGSFRSTYAEEANLAVNQTVMRSISTSVISALPIIALMIVAVWMMGVGTLKDLALIQLIGVVEGVFSSIFLATPILVSLMSRRKDIRKHAEGVAKRRQGILDDEAAAEARRELAASEEAADFAPARGANAHLSVSSPDSIGETSPRPGTPGTPGVTGVSWRPNQRR